MTQFVFFGGMTLPDGDRLVLNKDLELEDQSHTYLGLQRPGTEPKSLFLDWNVRGWYSRDNALTLIGEDGEFLKLQDREIVGSGEVHCGENIFTGARNLSVGSLCWGMRKTLCIERNNSVWEDFSAGLDPSVIGIRWIDANHNGICYLVGWRGIIYRLEGSNWQEMDSPVNVHLNACTVSDSDIAYVCGEDGIVIECRGETLRVLDHDFSAEDFMGFHYWEGGIFVFSQTAAYSLDQGNLLPSFAWNPSTEGVFVGTMSTERGFWLFTEFKVHVFADGGWQ